MSQQIKATNLKTKEEVIYTSIKEAAKELDLNYRSIHFILGGLWYQAKGYTFKYIDDDNKKALNEKIIKRLERSNLKRIVIADWLSKEC